MTDLEIAIEHLYLTFRPYTTEGIHYCNCGCIDEQDVKKLHSKSLRLLEKDDLISYHGSALYTWGDVEHYKHFLPRICELMSMERELSYVTLYDFHVKLDVAEWAKWPENERQAIIDYVAADWADLVNNRHSDIRDSVLEQYCNFLDMNDLLHWWWVISKSKQALRNKVYFLYYYGNQILHEGLRISDKTYKQEFLTLLHEEGLVAVLETHFFENEQSNPEYADIISIVLQMIEQELRINPT
jgi:hypothetical protein